VYAAPVGPFSELSLPPSPRAYLHGGASMPQDTDNSENSRICNDNAAALAELRLATHASLWGRLVILVGSTGGHE
jgi:hypothetical protein